MRTRSVALAMVAWLAASTSIAEASRLRDSQAERPPSPLLVQVGAARGAVLRPASPRPATHSTPPSPGKDLLMLPLSAGLSMISIPLHTDSQTLSDLLPDLPDGARVWTWNPGQQAFVEGFDQTLSLGSGVFLYLPIPTVLVISGEDVVSSSIPVELKKGWNLVGVPYNYALPRFAQTVFVSGVKTAFNDAAEQGVIVEPVFTLDPSGSQRVDAAESFEPLHAYWVYATGDHLLELQPALLQNPAAVALAKWTAEQAGAAVAGWAVGQLIASISPNPNQDILDKLDAMNKQVQSILDTQNRILDQFRVTQTQIRLSEEAIKQKVGEVNLESIRADVASRYDDAFNANGSLKWFAEQAKTADGRSRITDRNREEFARNVLTTWNFVRNFETIRNAIIPVSGDGVVDNFANQIVLSGATGATLQDRYRAMELYFNSLVGLQVKCMTLITNAYNTLAAVPGSGYAAGDAERWRTETYAKAIAAETLRFRDAAERIIAANLRVASEPTEAPVSVPSELADVIIPSLDHFVYRLANEPAGVRVRVFVGVNLNEPNTYTIVDQGNRPIMGLPSADSGLWKTLPAGAPYDAWRFRNNPGAFATDLVPEFYRATTWIMYRTILPSTTAYGTYQLKLADKWGVTDDSATPGLYGFKAMRVGNVDDNNQPSATGSLFGTVTLAKRAAARTILRIYNDGKSSAWNYCPGGVSMGKEHDYFIISGNCYTPGGWASYQRVVPFYFAGPGESAAGDWQMGLTTSIAGCGARQDICEGGAYSLAQVQLLDNEANFVNINRTDSATQLSYHWDISWQKSHTYKFHMRLLHTGTSNATASQVWRGPLMIRFKP